jgi:hypothetical protein
MARRSPRKKTISSETIIESDDDFVAVSSDDSYVSSQFSFVLTDKVFSFYLL